MFVTVVAPARVVVDVDRSLLAGCRPRFSSSCTSIRPGMMTECLAGAVAVGVTAVVVVAGVFAVLGTPYCHPGHIPGPLLVALPERTLVLDRLVVAVAGRHIHWAELDRWDLVRTAVTTVAASVAGPN